MMRVKERFSAYNQVLSVLPFRKLLIGQGLSMAGDAICLAALPIAFIREGWRCVWLRHGRSGCRNSDRCSGRGDACGSQVA